MPQKIITYIAFKLIRLSGLLFFVEALLSALATGQAEISYTLWIAAQVAALSMLIIARIEGIQN